MRTHTFVLALASGILSCAVLQELWFVKQCSGDLYPTAMAAI